jgi:hypothetical protein
MPKDVRIEKLIEETIATFKLDLKGLTVLTEAATGYYSLAPIIAAKAGAERVLAYAKSSRYATASEAKSLIEKIGRQYQTKQIEVITRLNRSAIAEADIVTNSNSLRPMDKDFIAAMKEGAVIALMYESWEFRPSDLDLDAAKARQVMVMGTNESAAGIFDYVQPLLVKMIFEAGLEILRNNFLIISSDNFGLKAKQILLALGAKVKLIGSKAPFDLANLGWSRIDGIIAADVTSENVLIGEKGIISIGAIGKIYPETKIIQFAGEVQQGKLADRKIDYYPKHQVGARRMGQTFADLGPKAVIEYLVAGLKVGEEQRRAREISADFSKAKLLALKNPLCQDLK